MTISVKLDRDAIRLVDRQVRRGKFRSRDQAIRAAVRSSFSAQGGQLTAKDVLAFVRKGREEHRKGKARVIKSLSELR